MWRRVIWGAAVVGVCACHRGEPVKDADPQNVAADEAPEDRRLRGTIEAIRLHNINKALGHYTYNVELSVRHRGVTWAGELDPASIPEVVTVRVDKILWDRLPQARRDAIAPDGPGQMLEISRYDDYAVGQDVALSVTFTSPELAVLAR